MKLEVTTLKAEKFFVEVDDKADVLTLKKEIEKVRSEVKFNFCKIFFHGKILKDYQTLEECSVKNGDFVVVMSTKESSIEEKVIIKSENNDSNVTWKDENTGWMKTSFGGSTCFRPLFAIQCAIHNFCNLLVNTNPDIWKGIDDSKIVDHYTFNRSMRDTLNLAYPKFSNYNTVDKLMVMIKKHTAKKLTEVISKYDIKDSKNSNFVFLALLGKSRNWKEGCAICLTDKIMGTTCGCGHTEIAVFRPCGHSICVSPCFIDFMKQKDISFGCKTMKTEDGQEFYMPSVAAVDGDNYDFECPLCRTQVTSVFRAEDTRMDCKSSKDASMKDLFDTKEFAELIVEEAYLASSCDKVLYDIKEKLFSDRLSKAKKK